MTNPIIVILAALGIVACFWAAFMIIDLLRENERHD